jgi:hypothetical protein
MQNTTTIKQRLAQYLEYLGIGQAKFAEIIGVSRGFANNVGDSIRTENLEKIKNHFPELNTIWLLTGEGEMLKTGSVIQKIGNNCAHNTQVAGSSEVAVLKERVRCLESLVEEKERTIKILLDKR